MPKGPLGGPRPGADVKMVVIVPTKTEVDIENNPLLIQDINDSLKDIDVGPGFGAGTIEQLGGGVSGGLFSEFLGGEELNPVAMSGSKGVYMTFSVPSLTEDQLNQIENSVADATGTNTNGFIVGCL